MRSLRRISCLQCRTEIVLASFNHGIITLKKNVDQRVKDPDKVKAFRVYLYFQRIPILVHLTISFLRITTLPILIAGAALVKFQFEIPFRIKARLFKCWLSFER